MEDQLPGMDGATDGRVRRGAYGPAAGGKEERIVDAMLREASKTCERAGAAGATTTTTGGKGKIVPQYKSLEYFDGIVEAMTGE